MLQIWIFAGVIGLVLAKDENIKITAMKRVLDDTNKQLQIEYSSQLDIADKDGVLTDIHLQIDYTDSGADKQITLHAISPVVDGTAIFKYDLQELDGKDVKFLLATVDDNNDMMEYCTTGFKLPVFLGDGVEGAWVGKENDNSLRIAKKSEVGDFQLNILDCKSKKLATGTDPCFYVGSTKDLTSPLELCQTINNVLLCDVTQTFDTDSVGSGTAPTSVELIYPEGPTLGITPKKDTEYVVYKTNSDRKVQQDSVVVCQDSPCIITSYESSSEELQILYVNLNSKTPEHSTIQTFTDYVVIGTPLSNSLIETRWTRKLSEDKYHVSIKGGAAAFTDTTVTCEDETDAENYHCFAYFTGLDKNTKYKLSVQIIDGTDTVTLTDTKTDNDSPDMELKISSLDTKWHKGLRSFGINACVHQADPSNLSTYEVILINKRGQWEKVKGITHRIGNELCFDTLHVDIYNFDLSEDMTLVVVKRGSDGITVLDSAHTHIAVRANQIVASLQNSTSGKM